MRSCDKVDQPISRAAPPSATNAAARRLLQPDARRFRACPAGARLRRSAFRPALAKLPAKPRPRSGVSQRRRIRAFPLIMRGHRSGASNETAPERAPRSRRSERRRACDFARRAASSASVNASSSQPATARKPAPRPPSPENFNVRAAEARSSRNNGAYAPTAAMPLLRFRRLFTWTQVSRPRLSRDRRLTAFGGFVNMFINAIIKAASNPSSPRGAPL